MYKTLLLNVQHVQKKFLNRNFFVRLEIDNTRDRLDLKLRHTDNRKGKTIIDFESDRPAKKQIKRDRRSDCRENALISRKLPFRI